MRLLFIKILFFTLFIISTLSQANEHVRLQLKWTHAFQFAGYYAAVKKGQLEFEILETNALEEITYIVDIIQDCKALGISFSLDDFGTGYSSITYLKQLPATTLKIDCSFVIDMLDDEDDRAIVEGIIELSNTFKRDVIAEGVETLEHSRSLLSLGCELAQGYGIAKPMGVEQLQEWMKSWKAPLEWVEYSQS